MEFEDYSMALEEAKKVIKECFQKYKISEVFVAFNGGKDCTVLLDLILDVLDEDGMSESRKHLQFVYIKPENSFTELDSFILEVEKTYGIKLTVVDGNIKSALSKILTDDPNIKACFMGTRRSDPFSENFTFFQMTDDDWPRVMRISPLLNWSYGEIWSYLISKNVPYCTLYNQGYTSLGNKLNTIPNPSLKTTENGTVTYKPAYLLKDGTLERKGRISLQNGK